MKLFIAYALVVVGVPIFIGHIVGLICSMPVSIIVGLLRRAKTPEEAIEAAADDATEWVLSENAKLKIGDRIAHASLDIFSGFWTILAVGFLFHLFGLTPSVFILLILAGWEYLLTKMYKQAGRTFYCTIFGLIFGWVVVSFLFAAA
jgi:hypothetical protein